MGSLDLYSLLFVDSTLVLVVLAGSRPSFFKSESIPSEILRNRFEPT